MKNVVVLGSTGSVGTQALDVLDKFKDDFNVFAISAYSNIDVLEKQIKKFSPKYVVVVNKKAAHNLKKRLNSKEVVIEAGKNNLNKLVTDNNEIDIVLNSIVGAAGLEASLSTLKAGHDLALANKESLVVGGHLIKKELQNNKSKILPVDSEHSAIFHLLEDKEKKEIKNILLTASGGPFFNKNKRELKNVTVEEALDHPNWDMGNKITIDSATMMNKGLEVIEAHWLFDIDFSNIKIVVHPQSIIHSMVEFCDNTITAELGAADMRTPIQSALTYPQKRKGIAKQLNLFEITKLNFLKPDFSKFPTLNLAYEAGKIGESMPTVLNAANEVAVNNFLNKNIGFLDIAKIVEKTMNKHDIVNHPSLDEVLATDEWARAIAREECK